VGIGAVTNLPVAIEPQVLGDAVGHRHVSDVFGPVQRCFGVEGHLEAIQIARLEIGDSGGLFGNFLHHEFGESRGLAVVVLHRLELPLLAAGDFYEFPGACDGAV